MIFLKDRIPGFDEFNDEHSNDGSPVLEMYIAERGVVIPEKDWRKIPTHMRSSTGLNFGKDEEETLYKYTDKSGVVGQVAMLDVVIPVRIDQVSHAAEQIYRWEHRFDQVDQEEVVRDVEMAAPKLAELVLNNKITPGLGANARTGERSDYRGLVWLYNIESGLNVIVQVKGKEQREHAFKIAIITVLRRRNMTWSRASEMAKITVSSTEARIVYVPTKATP